MLPFTLRLLIALALVVIVSYYIIPLWFPSIKNKKLKEREQKAIEQKEYLSEKMRVLEIEQDRNAKAKEVRELESRK